MYIHVYGFIYMSDFAFLLFRERERERNIVWTTYIVIYQLTV